MSDDSERVPEVAPRAVSRRGFLSRVVAPAAAAVVAAPTLSALAAAAAKSRKPAAPRSEAAAKPATQAAPDFSVCRTPAERAALERQWKQMIETVETLRKTPLPVGAAFATGALAPRRLRRGEA
ncbi:MAG: hypothetical protein ABI960_05990 [Candidatus Eisenbacteria bacterium]